MAGASVTEIRATLRRLGRERTRREKADAKLTTEIQAALRQADGKVSVSEQAKLLRLHRTTLYRVYK